jgi:9-cis-beta-carotene 9',10'-cleaving dioxygenase
MEAVCGASPMISALTVNPSKSTSPIYLLPRFPNTPEGKKRDWRIPIEVPSQLWLLHVGNAFEVKQVHGNLDIQIQASACSYQWFNFRKLFGKYIYSFILIYSIQLIILTNLIKLFACHLSDQNLSR